MTLWRKAGSGALIRNPGGSLGASVECCCDPYTCPTEGTWSVSIEDLDGAWEGTADLGPHTMTWNAGTSKWEVTIPFFISCFDVDLTIEMHCTDGVMNINFESESNDPFIPDTLIPWNGAGSGFNYLEGLVLPSFQLEFDRGVDAQEPCYSGGGADSSFRLTFIYTP